MSPRPPAQFSQQQVSHVRVDADSAGRRIDNYLLSLFNGVPRSRIYSMLRKGEVRVNGRRVGPEARLVADDMLRLPPVRSEPVRTATVPTHSAESLKPLILYEDRGLVVINKPAGMAVHGGSGLRFGVIEALRHLRPEAPFLELVHRLDRDTSGCLMVAKKSSVLKRLHEALRLGRIDKHYLTLLKGRWPAGEKLIRERLQKNVTRGGERMVTVAAQGKESTSLFRLLETFAAASLVEVELETGRTHQIRVHAAHSGHPVAGDEKYGDPEFNRRMKSELGLRRLFLHAARLRLPDWEDGEPLLLDAPLASDLAAVVQELRRRQPVPSSIDIK